MAHANTIAATITLLAIVASVWMLMCPEQSHGGHAAPIELSTGEGMLGVGFALKGVLMR